VFKKITLKFTAGTKKIELDAQGITIFVGPNNSGKSLVLREIEGIVSSYPRPADMRIVDDYELEWPTEEELEDSSKRWEGASRGLPEGRLFVGRFSSAGETLEGATVDKAHLLNVLKAREDKQWVASQYSRFGQIRLDGRTRFNLTNDRDAGDLLSQPQNMLSKLFVEDKLREEVRKLVKDAFGLHFVVDPTNGGRLRIRLSHKPPPAEEQSLNVAARNFHANAIYIKDASDGIQAYVGIICAVVSGSYRSLLIDEPEAFLHPPLARLLGKQLATTAADRRWNLFASTHSSDFLIGCVQASKNVRVVRLEYSNGQSQARVVDPDILSQLLRTPLMRSANVISALFYDGVVVTESDNDRVFYTEIYHRLSEDEEMPSVLFINAQNKQTIKDIIGPLRNFGIPAAAIADIDVLKDGGKVWTGWLDAAAVPAASQPGYSAQRDAIKKEFDASGKDMKRDGGINVLSDNSQKAAIDLFEILESYGLFVVPGGELECWLPKLGATGKKTEWVLSALQELGDDPKSQYYVKPAADDVWAFIRKVVKWIKDPGRKGTS
jgi:energy-coupling factor transporter ATP-binding protein EcfA2